MIFEQTSNQTNQVRQISISHGSKLTESSNEFVPGKIETDMQRARLRSGNILNLNRPEHIALKS